MGQRRKSRFELEVFDQRATPRRRLDEFLELYVHYFTPQHRTDTSQLLYYIKNPLSGRRIIYFGLCYEGQPAGFAVLMCYPAQAVGIFDFIVLAPNRRGEGAYFAFTNLIVEYLEEERIVCNYLVAEVVRAEGQLTHGVTSVGLIKLLRRQGFRTARMPYKAPDPIIVSDPGACEAALMLVVEPDQEELPAAEMVKLVELIYLNHYLLWFKGVMPPTEGRAYEQAVRAECGTICQMVRGQRTITLEGSRSPDLNIQYKSERTQIVTIVAGATAAVISTAVALKQEPRIGLPLAGVSLVALAAALSRKRIARSFLRLFGPSG